MIVLYILLGLAAFIALLLICPVRININYDNSLRIKISYLFLHFKVLPSEKKEPDKHKKDIKKAEKSVKHEDDKLKKLVEECGFIGAFNEIKDIISPILKQFKMLLSRAKVSPFDFYLLITGENAAATAMEYGAVCAVIYPALAFLQTLSHFKKSNIVIRADYIKHDFELYFNATVRFRPIYAFTSTIKILAAVIKLKKEQSEITEG